VIEIAAHVLTSFAAWRSPRKTWLCRFFTIRVAHNHSPQPAPAPERAARVAAAARSFFRIGHLDTINAFERRYKEFVYRHGREISTT
jgi:hypothetical protein